MSRDFTLVLAGSRLRPEELQARCDRVFAAHGFSIGADFIVSNPWDDRDAPPDRDLPSEDRAALADWRSIYADYVAPDLTLGLQCDANPDDYASALVFVSMEKMYALHAKALPAKFYELIGDLAGAGEAIGGYGGFEVEYRPDPPIDTLRKLLASSWEDAVLPALLWTRAMRLPMFAGGHERYQRFQTRDCSFSLDRAFLAICAKFGRPSSG